MIEVGEYVRTKNGVIDKVQNYSYSENIWHCENGMCIDECNCIGTHLEDIVKHSKNIIDLIEVGDYVNGYPVRRIPNFNNELCNFDLNTMEWTPLKNIDVYYNILTKEQYMQNCYTVERKEERIMELEEAIRTYNLFEDSPKIRQFEEARHFLLEEMKNRKPREEYYKSSNLYDYYILYPYKSLEFSENKITEVERNYDCIGKERLYKSERHFCLSLCKMSQNEIIELIENHIKEDNEKYLKEVLEKVEEER